MNFHHAKIFCGLIVLAGIYPAAAQSSIVFSRPKEDVTEKADAFLPEKNLDAANAYNAPGAGLGIFNTSRLPSFDVLPGASAAPALSPEQSAQWQKFLEGKKKWAMMTPEEILGVPTPEKILGIPSAEDQQKMTVEEKFLARQERLDSAAATNGFRAENYGNDRRDGNPFQRREEKNEPYPGAAELGADKFRGADTDANASLAPKPPSVWASAFNFPAPPPPATPEQLAGMERFRELMEPAVAPDKTLTPSATPVVPPDPYLQRQPDFNPLGSSVAQLPSENFSSQPKGIQPLPTLTHPYVPPAKKNSAQAQLPPWMSSSPSSQFQTRQF